MDHVITIATALVIVVLVNDLIIPLCVKWYVTRLKRQIDEAPELHSRINNIVARPEDIKKYLA